MKISDNALMNVRERGFAVIEGFLGDEELAAAQEALWRVHPEPSCYFDDHTLQRRYARSQFGRDRSSK